MSVLTEPDDRMVFAPEDTAAPGPAAEPWRVLVVDDDEEIHKVTRLALQALTVRGRPLSLISAYAGHEAVEVMRREPEVALILMDVVMESEHAGLEAVATIRTGLANRRVRIVVRTGQPGNAPPLELVRRFDIDDYKEKTELTVSRLIGVVEGSLAAYEGL
jgi:CheY-like chemotaxis protein